VPITGLPANTILRSFAEAPEVPLAPWAFAAAFTLFLLDCLAALMLSGAWQRFKQKGALPLSRSCSPLLDRVMMGAPRMPISTRAEFHLQTHLPCHHRRQIDTSLKGWRWAAFSWRGPR
jgi:hypothetical protein